MAPAEEQRKKRKREKDTEKHTKKQRREDAAATDVRTEDGREEARSEKRKKERKEKKDKKSKSNDDPDVDPVQTTTVSVSQPADDARVDGSYAMSRGEEKKLKRHSPFTQRTTSLYLPLSPCAARFPLEGLLAEHISPLILTYYPPLRGVLLSYRNARLSEHPRADGEEDAGKVLTQCINEYAVTFTWLTADFLLFRPRKGTWMEGHVRLGNESMVGLVCYNYFNAVIDREKMPEDWSWVPEEGAVEEQKGRRKGLAEGAGHFRDGRGKKVEGRLVFRVEDFDALQGDSVGGGGVSITGTLLPERKGT